MIAVIRIKGQVGIDKRRKETLNRLGLKRKYSCVVLNEEPINMGMIKSVKEFVAHGKIDEETLKELIEKRGKEPEKMMKELKKEKIKLVFRLHPPRGGINSKEMYPKGVLGDNKEEINKLIKRML